MLDWAEQQAQRAGYRSLRLYTNAMMNENLALYTRLGYWDTRSATITNIYRIVNVPNFYLNAEWCVP